MATAIPTANYWLIKYKYINAQGNVGNRELVIDAPTEKEALDIATKRLTANHRWHKITGSLKA